MAFQAENSTNRIPVEFCDPWNGVRGGGGIPPYCYRALGQLLGDTETLGYLPFPFFPGVLLFRKPSKTQGKQPVLEKNMKRMEKESTPRETRSETPSASEPPDQLQGPRDLPAPGEGVWTEVRCKVLLLAWTTLKGPFLWTCHISGVRKRRKPKFGAPFFCLKKPFFLMERQRKGDQAGGSSCHVSGLRSRRLPVLLAPSLMRPSLTSDRADPVPQASPLGVPWLLGRPGVSCRLVCVKAWRSNWGGGGCGMVGERVRG